MHSYDISKKMWAYQLSKVNRKDLLDFHKSTCL